MQKQKQKLISREDVKWWFKIIGIAVVVLLFIVQPAFQNEKNIALIQKSIDTIENNHLSHLQNYAEEIKNLQEKNKEYDKSLVDIKLQLNTIITLLGGQDIQ